MDYWIDPREAAAKCSHEKMMEDNRSGKGFNALPSPAQLERMDTVDRWRHHNNKLARVGSSSFDFEEAHIINPFEAAAKLSDEKTKEDIRLGKGINKCPSYRELQNN